MTDASALIRAQLKRLIERRDALEIELGEITEQISLAEHALAAVIELNKWQGQRGGLKSASVSEQKKLPRNTLNYIKNNKDTIKSHILRILHSKKEGRAEALEILSELNRITNSTFDRTSLSPQLSRLKNSGMLKHRSPYWELVYDK